MPRRAIPGGARRGAPSTTSKESACVLRSSSIGRARDCFVLLSAALATVCLNLALASGDAQARAGAKPTIGAVITEAARPGCASRV